MTRPYFIDEFELSIDNKSYLVFVNVLKECAPQQDSPESLPEWIFKSRMAIWLFDESMPIYDRAKRGEEIKNQIIDRMERPNHLCAAG